MSKLERGNTRISIIICTRDRADDLRETLNSLGSVAVPEGCSCELLVVDNASRDHTPQIVAEIKMPNMTLRALREPKPGQCHARNLGLAEASGEIVVFTDDDLRYPIEWLEEMTTPLLRGEAHAATGAMRLAPHLERPWMEPMHRIWLAAPPGEKKAGPTTNLVGANMAFRREVLDKVPAFDTELGPGALGFGDDNLFSHQLLEAGYTLVSMPLRTEHHFLTDRLTRASFLNHAKKLGMSGAYTAHHWEHQAMRTARANLLKKIVQLTIWRATHRAEVERAEGMHASEMHHLRSLHIYGHFLIERRRPRNYDRHGLVKRPPC